MQWDLDLVLHEALTRNDLVGFFLCSLLRRDSHMQLILAAIWFDFYLVENTVYLCFTSIQYVCWHGYSITENAVLNLHIFCFWSLHMFIGFLNEGLFVACHLLTCNLTITAVWSQHHLVITVNRNNTAGSSPGSHGCRMQTIHFLLYIILFKFLSFLYIL